MIRSLLKWTEAEDWRLGIVFSSNEGPEAWFKWCISYPLSQKSYWWKRIKKYCQHHAVSGATTLKRLRPGGLAWDVIITALLNREKNHSQETKCGTKIYHFLEKNHTKHYTKIIQILLENQNIAPCWSCLCFPVFTPSLVGLLFCQLCQVRCCPS